MSDSGFINEAELESEYKRLDLLREKGVKTKLTDEQFKLIHYARTNGKPIRYSDILTYWVGRGWKPITMNTLRTWYEDELSRQGMGDKNS